MIFMVDVFADAINKIKVYETAGMRECVLPSTTIIKAVLNTMKDNGYISGFEEYEDGKFRKLKVALARKINDIGVIKPRHAVAISDLQKYEARHIPSKNFGIVIISTPSGIMTTKQAMEKKIGGRLLAYVY